MAVGHFTRARIGFSLILAAASWGVLREAIRPVSWRRTVRHEFKLTMRQATGGGLATTVVTASLVGVAMVYEALYWLGVAGQAELTGSLLVTVLVRELTPLLVGFILLGRSGMLTVTELGMLQTGGQVRAMYAQGIDPFLLLVLPRTLAFALSSFTLGILFAATALVFGFIVSGAIGTVRELAVDVPRQGRGRNDGERLRRGADQAAGDRLPGRTQLLPDGPGSGGR